MVFILKQICIHFFLMMLNKLSYFKPVFPKVSHVAYFRGISSKGAKKGNMSNKDCIIDVK